MLFRYGAFAFSDPSFFSLARLYFIAFHRRLPIHWVTPCCFSNSPLSKPCHAPSKRHFYTKWNVCASISGTFQIATPILVLFYSNTCFSSISMALQYKTLWVHYALFSRVPIEFRNKYNQNKNSDLLSSLLTDIIPRYPGMLAAGKYLTLA